MDNLDENSFDDMIEGETPELDVKPDGTVAIEEEQLETPDISQFVEEEPSKIEEPETVIPETEVAHVSPFEQKFNELGLSRQFPGGIDEMLSKIPDMNRYITSLEGERNALRDRQAPEQPNPEPTTEDIFDDPRNYIKQAVAGEMETVNNKLADYEYKSFVASKPDFAQMEPLMEEQLRNNPGLRTLRLDAMPILYRMAKSEQVLNAPPPAPAPAPTVNKDSAQISASKKVETNKDTSNMTMKELENHFGVIPLYND